MFKNRDIKKINVLKSTKKTNKIRKKWQNLFLSKNEMYSSSMFFRISNMIMYSMIHHQMFIAETGVAKHFIKDGDST